MVNKNKIYLEQSNFRNAEREEYYIGDSSSASSEEASNYPEDQEVVSKVKTIIKRRTRNAPKRYQVARKPNICKHKGESEVDKKMRVLQQLIPNCPNVSNACVLDVAIAYIKILQNQLQLIWSSANAFRAGMYSSSMLSLAQQNMMHQFHASSFPSLVGSRTRYMMYQFHASSFPRLVGSRPQMYDASNIPCFEISKSSWK